MSYGPGDETRYLLEIWRQPWLNWLKSYLYVKYWKMYKLPGYGLLEKIVDGVRGLISSSTDPFSTMPWSAKQDLRLHDLKSRKRQVVASVTVTEEQFNLLKGHDE